MPLVLRPPEGEAGKALPAILVGCFVAFGGVLFGYDTGSISDILAMDGWLKLFGDGPPNAQGIPTLTASRSSQIVSILSAGTFFGALSSAPAADFFGRRIALMLGVCVFFLGVCLQTASVDIALLLPGRFFAGFGVGWISAVIPIYQSETAPRWIRGTVVSCYQWAITIGLLLASIVGHSTANMKGTACYRIPIAVQFLWGLILIGGLLFLPETPRMWIKRGNTERAAKSLSILRRLPVDHPAIIEELAEIEATHQYDLTLGKATYLECFKGNVGKRLLTGCLLQALQQLTGVNFIFYYGPQYFKNSGIHNTFTVGMITTAVNVCSTIPGLYLVEAWGRRSLLLFGAIGMCISQFIVGAVGTAIPTADEVGQRVLIAFVCIYIFFFACSWGPCAWVVTGEIFPLKVRAKALSMTTASNWLLNWAIGYMTPYLVDKGPGDADLQSKVFFLWGSFCFICIAFVYTMIYETKGLSLEETDEMYLKVNRAWKSRGFVATVKFTDIQQAGVAHRSASLAEAEQMADRKNAAALVEDVTEVKV